MPPPIWITTARNRRLSGRVAFSSLQSWMPRPGRVVLLVEEVWQSAAYQAPPRTDEEWDRLNWRSRSEWREATALDLADPSLRWLIDGPGIGGK